MSGKFCKCRQVQYYKIWDANHSSNPYRSRFSFCMSCHYWAAMECCERIWCPKSMIAQQIMRCEDYGIYLYAIHEDMLHAEEIKISISIQLGFKSMPCIHKLLQTLSMMRKCRNMRRIRTLVSPNDRNEYVNENSTDVNLSHLGRQEAARTWRRLHSVTDLEQGVLWQNICEYFLSARFSRDRTHEKNNSNRNLCPPGSQYESVYAGTQDYQFM
ncbi:hypothetical protein SS50377_21588 [Spironucleus salmonicida]|uniref:Uncharacterized protein n=1 Tax=Spironucleus salmonicida TaxID=348837 RepID=A0A9P8LXA0_9EUKA|nr:hypothetical protein SS50377_21588 [Spironucleus salmonicida]